METYLPVCSDLILKPALAREIVFPDSASALTTFKRSSNTLLTTE